MRDSTIFFFFLRDSLLPGLQVLLASMVVLNSFQSLYSFLSSLSSSIIFFFLIWSCSLMSLTQSWTFFFSSFCSLYFKSSSSILSSEIAYRRCLCQMLSQMLSFLLCLLYRSISFFSQIITIFCCFISFTDASFTRILSSMTFFFISSRSFITAVKWAFFSALMIFSLSTLALSNSFFSSY